MAAFLLLASIQWDGLIDTIAVVEFNSFGGDGNKRIAIIFRDSTRTDKRGLPTGEIVDWRWFTHPDQVPRPTSRGRLVAVWNEDGIPRTVYCLCVWYTSTPHDRELLARKDLPVHKRRKLSR